MGDRIGGGGIVGSMRFVDAGFAGAGRSNGELTPVRINGV
jgi:hypothetical protein